MTKMKAGMTKINPPATQPAHKWPWSIWEFQTQNKIESERAMWVSKQGRAPKVVLCSMHMFLKLNTLLLLTRIII